MKYSCHLKRSSELACIANACLGFNSDVSLSFLHLQSGRLSEVWWAVTHCFHCWFTNSLICSISLRAVLFLTGRLEGDDDLKCQEDFPRGHRGRTLWASGRSIQRRFWGSWSSINVFNEWTLGLKHNVLWKVGGVNSSGARFVEPILQSHLRLH